MTQATSTIQADFDRLALLSHEGWNHNSHYYKFLLQNLPSPCRNVLEIGCGAGSFSRRLAQTSDHVRAVDLSPNMIRIARERSVQFPNIDFQVADVMALELPSEGFDCIVSIATLHHVPMREVLAKLKDALKLNGVVVILDLFQPANLSDAVTSVFALPMSAGFSLIKEGRIRPPRAVREAWNEHGRHDSYLTLAQVHEVCADLLPGAVVRRHLFWRYSVVWKKEIRLVSSSCNFLDRSSSTDKKRSANSTRSNTKHE